MIYTEDAGLDSTRLYNPLEPTPGSRNFDEELPDLGEITQINMRNDDGERVEDRIKAFMSTIIQVHGTYSSKGTTLSDDQLPAMVLRVKHLFTCESYETFFKEQTSTRTFFVSQAPKLPNLPNQQTSKQAPSPIQDANSRSVVRFPRILRAAWTSKYLRSPIWVRSKSSC